MANPLVRSDTLEALEPIWSNARPSGGPTPIPPRNEPLFYIPSDDLPPTLLKLIYLAGNPPIGSSPAATLRSENIVLDSEVSSDAFLLDAPVASGSEQASMPSTQRVTETPPSHSLIHTAELGSEELDEA